MQRRQAPPPGKRGTIGARFGCRCSSFGPQCEVAARALRPCREQARRRLASRLEWLSRGTGPRRHHRRRMAAARLHRASGRQRRSVRPFDDRTNPRPWHRRHRHHLGSAVSPRRRGDLGDWHRPGPRHRRRPMRGAVNGPGVGPGLGIRREVVLLPHRRQAAWCGGRHTFRVHLRLLHRRRSRSRLARRHDGQLVVPAPLLQRLDESPGAPHREPVPHQRAAGDRPNLRYGVAR